MYSSDPAAGTDPNTEPYVAYHEFVCMHMWWYGCMAVCFWQMYRICHTKDVPLLCRGASLPSLLAHPMTFQASHLDNSKPIETTMQPLMKPFGFCHNLHETNKIYEYYKNLIHLFFL